MLQSFYDTYKLHETSGGEKEEKLYAKNFFVELRNFAQ